MERRIRAKSLSWGVRGAGGESRPMTKAQLQILQHSLGVDEYGRTPKGFAPYTRNHFCAGGTDEGICRELVAMGYMQQFPTTETLPYFNCSVTEAGKKAMRDESPSPPKLSRSQKRYQEFLGADSGESFIQWLKDRRTAGEGLNGKV
jgi:hypothetical protein